MKYIINADCLQVMDCLIEQRSVAPFQMVFMDPPDNIGLGYDGFKDSNPLYYEWLMHVIRRAVTLAPTVWISYYWKHDLEIKYRVQQFIKFERPTVSAKTHIWRYTFGQHNASDFGSGFRYLLRLTRSGAVFNPDDVRVKSERQMIGDPRANPDGRVPDDFWLFDIPRVVGNAAERRVWHPTQHPEELLERIIKMHSTPGGAVFDPFAGTGTTGRVAEKLHRKWVMSELSSKYVGEFSREWGPGYEKTLAELTPLVRGY